MSRFVDLTGRTFIYLKVTGYAGSWRDAPGRESERHWHCLCTFCGRECVTNTLSLTSGRTWHCPQCQPEQKGVDYRVNYENYIANFNAEERRQLEAITRGRTEPRIVAEAVDLIMRKLACVIRRSDAA